MTDIDLNPLRDCLRRLLSTHDDTAPFTDEDSLMRSGRLDSVDMMDIAFFLEEQYGADFRGIEMRGEMFDSVAAIRALLGSPPGAPAAGQAG